MAAVVDRRFDNSSYPLGVGGMNSAPNGGMVMPNQTIVSDSYGGWMTRGQRALVFGLLGLSLVLGLFLPGIIMIGMNWTDNSNGGIRGACSNDLVVRALTTCCFFIFHALLVIPMFIRGDRAHTVTVANQYGSRLASFWGSRLAHTAFILQIVGNIIELALLIWTAVHFWGEGLSNGNNSCDNNYEQFHDYMWAMLIGGFVLSTVSLLTSYKQYTSAAIRYQYGPAKNGGVLSAAP